jgi:hypothetical protein
MTEAAHTLMKIGEIWSESGRPPDVLPHIPQGYFVELANGWNEAFRFLEEYDFKDAFHYIMGLVACEEARVLPYGGSVSLVIRAFPSMKNRPVGEWAQVANWIVTNHRNPWSPFNFRRTREHWEMAQQAYSDPVEIAHRAAEIEREHDARKRSVHERHVVHEHITKLKKEAPPASDSIRQRMIEELEKEAGWPELRD